MAKLYDYVLKNPKVTSGYGKRTHPITGEKNKMHHGTDLISDDKNIYAIEDGYVQKIVTGKDKATTGYGNYIWVRYPRIGLSLFHAHCKKVLLKKGDKVKKGTIIAIMGKTGASTGVHLHLGMTKIGSDTWLNPQTYNYVPENTISVTSVVTRYKTKNQLKLIAENLRVRKSASTESDVVGMSVKNGIYNYYEIKADSKYTWYRIADNQWIADNKKYLEVYPGEDEMKIEELNKQLQELTDKYNLIVQENAIIKQDNLKLNDDLKNANDELKNYKLSFTANKNGSYKIKMIKGETLLIK